MTKSIIQFLKSNVTENICTFHKYRDYVHIESCIFNTQPMIIFKSEIILYCSKCQNNQWMNY